MPELPEVEAATRRLRRALSGSRIAAIRALHPSLARRLGGEAEDVVRGRLVRDVRRIGKYQVIELDDHARIVAHFRLDGEWVIESAERPLPKYARAAIETDSRVRVALVDPRALSTLTVHRGEGEGLPAIGPDPTDPAITAMLFRERLAGRRIGIKAALMDQRVISGVGNIYAAEALWRARIHPRAVAGRLSLARAGRLLAALRRVLDRGDPRGDRVRQGAPSELSVYDRAGKRCRRCGSAIRRTVIGGRGTYYCPGCQK